MSSLRVCGLRSAHLPPHRRAVHAPPLLITEHADRVREALNRTIDALAGIEPNDREALVRGVNEAVGVESLKLRDALNAALGAS